MTAILICGGSLSAAFLGNVINEYRDPVIYAVDGGLTVADRAGIMPDYLVGDFDTALPELVARYEGCCITLRHIPEKDATDTELAVDDALKRGADKIILLGATGSRMDHTMANIHMLYRIRKQGRTGLILNENNRISFFDGPFCAERENMFGKYVSFLPFGGDVTGLTLKGVKYPLSGAVLSLGNSLGVSNEVTEEMIEVSFETGYLLMIEARD